MKRMLMAIVVLLTLVTLACGSSSKNKDPEPAEAVEPANTPIPTRTPEPPPEDPEVTLGKGYHSDAGGFAFQTIPDYTVEDLSGFVSMEAPDAEPDIGPAILMLGGLSEENLTLEELYEQFMSDVDVPVSNEREVTVGGLPGLAVDVNIGEDELEIAGQIIVVAVTPTQKFSMFSSARRERWDAEFAPLVEAVVASIMFFEPTESTSTVETDGTLRQWATTATASSEYTKASWSANQATGAPDTPECGDFTTAWAAESKDTVEWLDLVYDTPVYPTEIHIIQNYNPDQVMSVKLVEPDGETDHWVYEGFPEAKGNDCPYTLSIPIEEADYLTSHVVIIVDQSDLQQWVEIDAVELVGYPE